MFQVEAGRTTLDCAGAPEFVWERFRHQDGASIEDMLLVAVVLESP